MATRLKLIVLIATAVLAMVVLVVIDIRVAS